MAKQSIDRYVNQKAPAQELDQIAAHMQAVRLSEAYVALDQSDAWQDIVNNLVVLRKGLIDDMLIQRVTAASAAVAVNIVDAILVLPAIAGSRAELSREWLRQIEAAGVRYTDEIITR